MATTLQWATAVFLVGAVGAATPLVFSNRHDAHKLRTTVSVISALVGGVCVTTGVAQCLESTEQLSNRRIYAISVIILSYAIILTLERTGRLLEATRTVSNNEGGGTCCGTEVDLPLVTEPACTSSATTPPAREDSLETTYFSIEEPRSKQHHCCEFPCCCEDEGVCRLICASKNVRGDMETLALARTFRQLKETHSVRSNNSAPRILLLPYLLAICFSVHSLVEGLGLGAAIAQGAAGPLGLGIVLHKGIAGFSVGASLLEVELSLKNYITAIISFALMTPIGVLVSTLIKGEAVRGILSAATAGTFLFIGTSELLPKAFETPQLLLPKVIMLFLGIFVTLAAEFME